MGTVVGRYGAAFTKPLIWGALVGGTGVPLLPSGPTVPVVAAIAATLAVVKPPRGERLLDLPERSQVLRVVGATAVAIAAAAAGVRPSAFLAGAVLHLAAKSLRARPLPAVVIPACVVVLVAAGWFVGSPASLLTSGDPVALGAGFRDVLRFFLLALAVFGATHDQRVADRYEAEREAAVRDERTRIARELHDVVAHHVSVMTIQTEAARSQLPARAEQADAAIAAAAESGRTAMTELRRLLGVLRADDGERGELGPQPGLDDVDALVAEARAAGIAVELTVTGARPPLSEGVSLSAYRIIQEAMTNAMKHASGSPIRIALDYGPDAVSVEVADEGGPAAAPAGGGGHGIIGMRERASLHDGAFHAGPAAHGRGWLVKAELPLDRVPT